MKEFTYDKGTYYFNKAFEDDYDFWDDFRLKKEHRLSFRKKECNKNRNFFIILFEKLRKELNIE